MKTQFEMAEAFYLEGEYESSFKLFQEMIADKTLDAENRADAYNMLGVIISGPCPYLCKEIHDVDETGIQCFKLSLELDPSNIGAAFNILESYDKETTGHKDRKLLKSACETLKKWHFSKMSIEEKDLIIETLKMLDSDE
jgi:hypothetical protein